MVFLFVSSLLVCVRSACDMMCVVMWYGVDGAPRVADRCCCAPACLLPAYRDRTRPLWDHGAIFERQRLEAATKHDKQKNNNKKIKTHVI